MKIIITAFGSFPGVDENPTEKLLKDWDYTDKSVEIIKQILPVEYDFCQGWAAENITEAIDLVIHLGVAVNRSENSLEKVGEIDVEKALTL